MKITFRLILAILAATAVLAGCTKEVTSPNFENDKVNLEGSRVIAVSFAPQTKTTLDGFQPKFEDGKDTVLISNTNALDTCVVSVKDNKATISTDLTGPLTAVYPYKAAKMNENNENEIDTVLVSTEQSGKFSDANICMAKMKDEKDESLSFENKTAVFCIHPPTAKSEYVEVSAEGFDITNNVPAGSTHTQALKQFTSAQLPQTPCMSPSSFRRISQSATFHSPTEQMKRPSRGTRLPQKSQPAPSTP